MAGRFPPIRRRPYLSQRQRQLAGRIGGVALVNIAFVGCRWARRLSRRRCAWVGLAWIGLTLINGIIHVVTDDPAAHLQSGARHRSCCSCPSPSSCSRTKRAWRADGRRCRLDRAVRRPPASARRGVVRRAVSAPADGRGVAADLLSTDDCHARPCAWTSPAMTIRLCFGTLRI